MVTWSYFLLRWLGALHAFIAGFSATCTVYDLLFLLYWDPIFTHQRELGGG